jgi:replicative DNA helicase
MSNKEYALQYIKKSLSVIPLKSPAMVSQTLPLEDLIKQCKVPLVSWKEFQTRRPTEQEVEFWFSQWPDANIGIVTGRISGIVVFDLDSEHAVQYAEDEGGLPDTPKVKTGKGYHYYMRYPDFEVRNDVRKELDIDIRADGGYVVAPPSIHGSGRHYEWEDCSSIFDIEPAPCEPWMIDYLKSISAGPTAKSKEKGDPKTPQNPPGTRKMMAEDEWVQLLKNGCTEGMRNQSATKLAGHLLAKGIAESEVWEILSQWNSRNNPPIEYSELRRTFDSVKKLESKTVKKEIEITRFLDTIEKANAEYNEQHIRVPFGLSSLGAMETKMNGGLVGGRFYLLGGIPSASKTMLTNNLADNICLNDQSVLFFSYDDGRSELRYRTFARFSTHGIEDFNQNRISKNELKAVCEIPEIKKIMGLKYVVENMINIEKWEDLIEQIKQRHQKAPVVMIDYLRKLRTDNKTSDERLRVDDILSSLTGLAKKHNIPIVAISELARDSYKMGQRLGMASFKESGALEYEASWLGILAAVEEKDGEYNLKNNWEKIIEQDGNVDLIVFKTKRGTGTTGKIPLKVDKNKMTVKDRKDYSKVDSVSAMTRTSMFGARRN